jgi:hypothetical protein
MYATSAINSGASPGTPTLDLGAVERSASMGIGVLLAAAALRPRLMYDVGLVAVAGYLMYRGATGSCPLRERVARKWSRRASGSDEFEALVGQSSRAPLPSRRPTADAMVDEASAESFPASDPPASTGATAAPTR